MQAGLKIGKGSDGKFIWLSAGEPQLRVESPAMERKRLEVSGYQNRGGATLAPSFWSLRDWHVTGRLVLRYFSS
jgi:hypothetical protein